MQEEWNEGGMWEAAGGSPGCCGSPRHLSSTMDSRVAVARDTRALCRSVGAEVKDNSRAWECIQPGNTKFLIKDTDGVGAPTAVPRLPHKLQLQGEKTGKSSGHPLKEGK